MIEVGEADLVALAERVAGGRGHARVLRNASSRWLAEAAVADEAAGRDREDQVFDREPAGEERS